MARIEKILFATDLSEDARKIFALATELANDLCCGVVILHVLEGTTPAADNRLLNVIGRDKLEEIKEKNRAQAHDKLIGKAREGRMIHMALSHLFDEAQASMEECHFSMDEILIAEGHVGEEIVRGAEEKGCGMIVMGHYRRGILERGPVTSAVRGVLKRSKIPVMLVPVE